MENTTESKKPGKGRASRKMPSLAAAARDLLKGLSADLDAARGGAPVHEARRRIKRLRSLALLLRPAIGDAAHDHARTHLKAAADALSARRRVEALSETVDRLAPVLPSGHTLRDSVLAHPVANDTEGGDDPLEAAIRSVDAAGTAIRRWKVPAGHQQLAADAFAATYRKARKRLRKALEDKDIAELHEARKLVIHHLHHLEFLRGALAEDPDERIAALNNLREALGDINDLAELEDIGSSGGRKLPKAVRRALHKRRTALIRRAREGWKPLFGRTTRAFCKRIGVMPPAG